MTLKLIGQKFKIILTIVVCVLASAAIFYSPETVKNGVTNGIILCFKIVIPSLFPFAVLSFFINSSFYGIKVPKFADKLTHLIFGLSAIETEIFLMSMISGYPMGAHLVNQLYKDDCIPKKRAETLLGFCVNGGPSFIIIAVGSGMFGYRKAGIILFISHITAAFAICRVSTLFNKERYINGRTKNKMPAISDRFVDSVASAANSMYSICACVVLFSAVDSVIKSLPLSYNIKAYVSCFFEVTSGLSDFRFSIPLTAFFLGFSGLSVHLQVLSAARSFSPNIIRFAITRLLHGALSYFICKIILIITPVTAATLSNSVNFISGKSDISVPAAISLILTVCLVGFYLSSFKRSVK